MGPSDYPSLFRAADGASRFGQRWYRFLIGAELVLVVLAAGFSVADGVVPGSWKAAAAVGVAVAMAGSLVSRLTSRWRRDDKKWFDGRAVAESVKTESWRYMMRLEPFHDDPTADRQFIAALQETLRGRPDLIPDVDSGVASPITTVMREVRALPLVARRDLYLRDRLKDQAGWYASKAKQNREGAQYWFLVTITAQMIALALAIVRPSFPVAALGVIAFLSAAAAAATAWGQISRHDELSRSYGLAAEEIRTLSGLAEIARTQDELAEIVELGELSISREHTMWVAKRVEALSASQLRALGRSQH
jgi:hypothetical protein